jgi:hypothetical protein
MEGKIIRKYESESECVNIRIDGRTKKEYNQDNKDTIQEYRKEYYEDNKEKAKEYYEDNKEKSKEYYEENKEKYLNRGK